jgi:ribosome-associated protein
MIPINERLHLDEDELSWTFARSGGPGGQNVNKVASKATLRWDLPHNTTLPEEVKARLRQQQKRHLISTGEMIFVSQRYRDQERNREDCLVKLRQAVLQALVAPKHRKATRPTRSSQRRRVQAKRHRSAAKSLRRRPIED